MPSSALNLMHTGFNKLHKMSSRPSRILHQHFWQEVYIKGIKRTIKGTKRPPNPSPQGDINSNL